MKNMNERKGDSNPENCMSGISKRKQSRIMRKGTAIFVAMLMTMTVATPLLLGPVEKASADADVGADDDVGADVGAKEVKTDYPLAFYNAGVTFEPLEGKVNIPEKYKSGPNGYYIVQYDGPLSADYKETIESMGGSVVGYIPKFAHLVYMGRETKEEVEKLPYVRWIGIYEPYYKVEKDLLDATGEVILTIVPFPMQPLKLENKLSKDYLNQMVEVIEPHRGSELMKESTEKRYGDLDFEKEFSEKDFSEKDFAPMMQKEIKGMGLGESKMVPTGYNFNEFREKAAKLTQETVLKQMGGEILPVDITPEYIRVRIDASKIPTIAKFGWVKSIYEWHPHQLHGTIAEVRNYTSAHTANLAGWNAGESWNTSWDRSDPPDELVRLSISDTGARNTHEQFGGNNNSGCYNAFSGTLPYTNERIFCYRFDGGDGPDNTTGTGGGHGTATTSILVGNCDDSPLENESSEHAPNPWFEGFANMGIVEVAEKSNLQGSDGTGSLRGILDAAYGDDCVVHSVSWGSATGSNGEEVDEWAYDNPNMLIFWAAGNENGSGNVGNVAKNIVVVGGLDDYNGNPDTSTHCDDDDSDGFTPDTGRVKPDLVMSYRGSRPADRDSDIDYWDSFSGTSGATPMAAGQAGVIHEMWRHDFFKNDGKLTDRPSSAAIKAIMINTADDSMMTNTTAHNRWQIGWGEPSIGNVYEIGTTCYSYRIWDIDETPARTTGSDNWTTWVQSTSTQPFNVTLVWLDDPSSTGTLVNDLDLTVIDESGNKYYGNHGLNWSRWSTANPAGDNEWNGGEGGTYDHVNNVENVRIQNPVDCHYKIVVNWHSTSSPQSFALVVSGVPEDAADLRWDKPIYNYADKATLTLVDTDENTNHSSVDTATVQLSLSGCDPFNVTLTETGANTSTFTADFYMVRDFPDADNVKLANSSSVTVLSRTVNGKEVTIILYYTGIYMKIIVIITITIEIHFFLLSAKYYDSWNSGTCQGYVYANSSYDAKAPTISDVRVDYLTHTGFGFSFETDEPARALLGIWLRWNESKSPREDAYYYMPDLDYYLNFYDFATLDDIRNQSLIDSGDVGMLLLVTTGTYVTEHSLAIIGAYPDADIYYLIGAFDEAGNTYIDDNGGNYYHVHTVPQDPTILFVGDDAASLLWLGIPYDAYLGYLFTMYAGYWPWLKEANITSCIVDSDPFGNYSDPWNETTFGNFWTSFNASANNSKNILHWDVGFTNTFYGYTNGNDKVAAENVMVSLFSSEVSSYFTDMEPNTLTTSEQTKIWNFHNASGRVSFFGASYWEAANTNGDFGNTDGTIPSNFVSGCMHVNMSGITTGASDPGDGNATGFDVTYGFVDDVSGAGNFSVSDWNCSKVGFYPGANARVDGQLLTENYAGSDIDDREYIDLTCMSGDELNISGIDNAQIELYYGTNANGYRPSLNATAVSWTDGTNKTYYNAVGWMGWNVYMTCVDKPSDPLYVDTWYKQLYDWYLDGSIQYIKGYADSIANVSVCAYEANSDHTVPIGSAKTNETGKYWMMVHVPATPGNKSFDLIACKPYYRDDANYSVTVTRGIDAWANFTMSKGVGNVTGVVTVMDPRWGPNPHPNFLTDVRVRIVNVTSVSPYKVDENTTVCGNGNYYFSGLPDGTYNVTVYGRRWINSSSPYDNFIETKYNSSVNVTGNQTTWANFTTDTGGISGRVYDCESGKPIKNAIVFAVEDGNPLKEEYRVGSTFWQSSGKALTDSSGGYYIGMLASGTYDLCALANGEYIVRRWNESIDDYDDWEYQAYGYYNGTIDNATISLGNETLNADFCLNDSWATIRGCVSNATGNISGAAIYMELTTPSWMAGYTATYGYTYTDCNGDYYVRVPTAEPGSNSTYKVKVMKVYHNPNEADINVQGGGTYWHNVSLTLGAAANVLMVFEWDYDKTQEVYGLGTYNHMFNDALNDSGCTGSYDTWNISWVSGGYMWRDETHYQPLLSDMMPYDVVLFFYEDYYIYPEFVFPNANAEHIKAYLKAGGSVGMFAHEWSSGTGGSNTDLMLNYFFATHVGPNVASNAANARGVADDPISGDWSDSAFEFANDHGGEDELWGDVDIFYWDKPGPHNDIWMAIRSDENTRSWKSTWFGFCITDFTGTSGTADEDFKKLINNIVCWLANKTNYAPTLSNASVTPENGSEGDTFNYTVCYTDPSPNSDVHYVNLIIDDGTPINITGNRIGDNDYTNGEMFYYNYGSPNDWHQGMHTYRFEAFDGTFDAIGTVGTYAGPWINDTVPPVISHRPACSWDIGEEIAIGCTVTDNVEVANVTLYYKDVGDSSWHHTVMRRVYIVIQIYIDIWWGYLGTIPSDNSTDTVCYYIKAEDTSGNSVIITPGVANLKATKLSNGIGVTGVNLTWDAWAGADKYNIYRSINKWSFNFNSPYDDTTNTYWVDNANNLSAGGHQYYIVRAYNSTLGIESCNSTMAVWYNMNFTGVDTRYWISLPTNISAGQYDYMGDIVTDIEGGTGSGTNEYINEVGYWDGTADVRYYYDEFLEEWTDSNSTITPGMGIYLIGNNASTWNWTVTGTDQWLVKEFSGDTDTVYWISIPQAGDYHNMSDIVTDIEGDTTGSDNDYIDNISYWNSATATRVSYYWTDGGWTGINSAITPGMGIYIELSGNTSPFTWDTDGTPIMMVTPPVPISSYKG